MLLVPSVIDAVTVHRRGARVRRRLDLRDAKPGRVRLAPLPLALDDDSVRITGAGRVSDMRVVLTTIGAQEDLPPPEDAELEAARLEKLRADARVEAHKRALQALDALTLAPRRYGDDGPAQIPTEQRLALVSFRREQSETLTRELRELRESARKATEQVAELEERKRLASTVRQTRAHEIRKGVDLTLETTEGDLWVEYTVPGARWTPSYVLRFDERADPGHASRCARSWRSAAAKTGATCGSRSRRPCSIVGQTSPSFPPSASAESSGNLRARAGVKHHRAPRASTPISIGRFPKRPRSPSPNRARHLRRLDPRPRWRWQRQLHRCRR